MGGESNMTADEPELIFEDVRGERTDLGVAEQ